MGGVNTPPFFKKRSEGLKRAKSLGNKQKKSPTDNAWRQKEQLVHAGKTNKQKILRAFTESRAAFIILSQKGGFIQQNSLFQSTFKSEKKFNPIKFGSSSQNLEMKRVETRFSELAKQSREIEGKEKWDKRREI